MRFLKKRSKKTGLPPGTLTHIGDIRTEKVSINIIDYTENIFEEKLVEKVEECFSYKDSPTNTWININGVHHLDLIKKIGECFDLHPLLLEDIVNTDHRPKIEDYEKYLFIVLKMLDYDDEKHQIKTEQISLIIGSNYVISFQEVEGDIFNSVRARLRNSKGRIRKMGSDYLAYVLIDAIVDNYFVILEKFSEKLEDIEEELVNDPRVETMREIQNMRREVILLRKSVWPLREIVNHLERGESRIVHKPTQRYIRDVYDHTIQIIDTIETFRDLLSAMLDLYLSTLSNKMNEVMKVLTIIATVFIPITFIAGIYGMNFRYMPELDWEFGYPVTLLGILSVSLLMLIFFRRKKWI